MFEFISWSNELLEESKNRRQSAFRNQQSRREKGYFAEYLRIIAD
ncbi:MAG: hypothetical protein ACTS8H_03110 [Arsenophonus sp. NC-PE1-MAG3]